MKQGAMQVEGRIPCTKFAMFKPGKTHVKISFGISTPSRRTKGKLASPMMTANRIRYVLRPHFILPIDGYIAWIKHRETGATSAKTRSTTEKNVLHRKQDRGVDQTVMSFTAPVSGRSNPDYLELLLTVLPPSRTHIHRNALTSKHASS